MTNEQIRQNAVKYSEQHCSGYVDGYIEGAHSRDEEIKELLKDRKKFYREKISALADAQELRNELDKLRNPWISVEDRLPEEHSRVLIMFCNGIVTYNDYIGVGDINYMKAHSKTITHWMPIPELSKGGEK